MKDPTRLALSCLVVLVSLGACSPSATPGGSAATDTIPVTATSGVFADFVANVGGAHVRVSSLVPAGADVHTYTPKPEDIQTVSRARLLVMNGLGLDDWLEETIRSANSGAPIVRLAVDLPGVTLLPGEEPATQNPHLWMDVAYAQLYVNRIADVLVAVDPANAADYASQATRYSASLGELDAWVKAQIGAVPEANRRIVTFHDAFPYFARAYGLEVVGVAVEAPGQEPSAGYTARLILAIRAAGVKAIFSEAQFPSKLVDQLGQETGTRVVADLYDDSLGDPPVTSYDALIRWDVERIVDAIR